MAHICYIQKSNSVCPKDRIPSPDDLPLFFNDATPVDFNDVIADDYNDVTPVNYKDVTPVGYRSMINYN